MLSKFCHKICVRQKFGSGGPKNPEKLVRQSIIFWKLWSEQKYFGVWTLMTSTLRNRCQLNMCWSINGVVVCWLAGRNGPEWKLSVLASARSLLPCISGKFCQIYSIQANIRSTCKLVAARSVNNELQWVRIFTFLHQFSEMTCTFTNLGKYGIKTVAILLQILDRKHQIKIPETKL